MKALTILLIRLFLGFTFFSSGLCKLTFGHFGQLIGPPRLIETLAEYDLGTFGYMIAISQVLIGMLVFSQRFSLIGLIAMIPMNACILGVTFSQQWTGTPYVNAVLLLLNIVALLYESDLIKFASGCDVANAKSKAAANYPSPLLAISALILIVLAILFTQDGGHLLVNIFATASIIIVWFIIMKNSSLILTERVFISLFFLSVLLIANADLSSLAAKIYLRALLISTFVGFLIYILALWQRYKLTRSTE